MNTFNHLGKHHFFKFTIIYAAPEAYSQPTIISKMGYFAKAPSFLNMLHFRYILDLLFYRPMNSKKYRDSLIL